MGARGIDGIGVKVRELGSLGGDIVGATGKQLVLVRLKPEESFLKAPASPDWRGTQPWVRQGGAYGFSEHDPAKDLANIPCCRG